MRRKVVFRRMKQRIHTSSALSVWTLRVDTGYPNRPPCHRWTQSDINPHILFMAACSFLYFLFPSPTCTDIIVGKKHLHKLSQSSNPALALELALEGTIRPGFEISYIARRMREKEQGCKKDLKTDPKKWPKKINNEKVEEH